MKKLIFLLLLLLPLALQAQVTTYNAGTHFLQSAAANTLRLGSPAHPNGNVFLYQNNEHWWWASGNTIPTMALSFSYATNYWMFSINSGVSGFNTDSTFNVGGVIGGAYSSRTGGAYIWGGLRVRNGANFDNNLTVSKKITAASMETPFAKADSAELSTIRVDTTKMYVADTGKVLPYLHIGPTSDHTGGVRTGVVELYFTTSYATATSVRDWWVVADSSNGVSLIGGTATVCEVYQTCETFGWANFGSESGGEPEITSAPSYGFGCATNFTTQRLDQTLTSVNSKQYFAVRGTGCGTTKFSVRMTVHYQITPGSTSISPIKIAGL